MFPESRPIHRLCRYFRGRRRVPIRRSANIKSTLAKILPVPVDYLMDYQRHIPLLVWSKGYGIFGLVRGMQITIGATGIRFTSIPDQDFDLR